MTRVVRMYSCLIKKLYMVVNGKGDENADSAGFQDALYWVKANLEGAGNKLPLNDLELLSVRYSDT